MKFLDLFAGIGGFRMAMEQSGHECVGYIEIDKFARKSYQAIFDTEGEWTAHDIRTVRASKLPKADAWCFGFPCQDISVSGKQLGFQGSRSSLFFAVTRLIRDLEEKDRPSFLLIENVKNLLSVNQGFDFAKLLIELDEIGYDAEWDVIDSSEVVPQHRERVFIIGHFRGRRTRQVFPISREIEELNSKSEINIVGNVKNPNGTSKGTREVVYSSDGIMGTLLASDYKVPKRIYVKQVARLNNTNSFGGNPQVGRIYDPSGVSPALNTMQGGGREPKIIGGGTLHLEIKEATKRGFAQASIGDTVNISQPNSKTRRGRVGHGIANTLQTSLNQGVVSSDLRIRKLTPKECWRLQGFPDWAFDRAEKVNSNSQLYKQAGNSVTVPVVYEIAKRLKFNQ